MKRATQERFLACAMTAALLFFLWRVAAWVEVRSHTSEPKKMSFEEAFGPIVSHTSNSMPPVIESAPSPVIQRRTPQIPELIQSEEPRLIPDQRAPARALQPLRETIELESANRDKAISVLDVSAREYPSSSGLSFRAGSGIENRVNRHPVRRAAIEVSRKPDTPELSLEVDTDMIKRSTRVLKAEEARKIIEWIQISESDLPPGVKRHVDYQPGNLTSKAQLMHEGESWEIYLMARMPSEELHVVIVRGDATYYVVDPSFKREGRRFRVGIARRDSGEITGIISEERAASSQDAVLHYDVFLAWWDKLRLTLQ